MIECCCDGGGGGGGPCCVVASVGGCSNGIPGVSVSFLQGGVSVGTSTTGPAGVTSPPVCLAAAATTVSVTSAPARFAAASVAYTALQVAAKCGSPAPLAVGLTPSSGYSCYCGQLDYVPTADTLHLTDSFYGVTATLTRTGANAGGGIWTGSAGVTMNACGGFGGCNSAALTINYQFWSNPGTGSGPFCEITASPATTPVGFCAVAGARAGSVLGGVTATSPAPGLVVTGTSNASNLYRSNVSGSCADNTSTYTITE